MAPTAIIEVNAFATAMSNALAGLMQMWTEAGMCGAPCWSLKYPLNILTI
jgi:hypothetical protein